MSSLKVINSNNVKIYAVSGHSNTKSIPDWLENKKHHKLKKDLEWRKRIQLIQDFEFPQASYRLKVTQDQNFCIVTGTYKPRFNVYEFRDLSLKFERHSNVENVDFLILSEDWTKTVFLQRDKSIEFHAADGLYHTVKIPKFGRQLSYNETSCDLLAVGSSPEVYRINLEQGRFLNPFETSFEDNVGINCIDVCKAHNLIGVGSDNGKLEFIDPRVRSSIGCLVQSDASESGLKNSEFMVSSLKFNNDGLRLAVGDSTGKVSLYDIRQKTPYLQKDHQYSLPIKKIQWLTSEMDKQFEMEKIASCDNKILKIWDCKTGEHFTSVEPTTEINDFEILKNSGMVMFANEGAPMQTYYIPQLGPAPRWCSFLDNLTEELEESKESVICNDYKFVTYDELKDLNLENLVGTEVLRAYMHGFLLDLRLYEKAKQLNSMPNLEEYKTKTMNYEKKQRRENLKRKGLKL